MNTKPLIGPIALGSTSWHFYKTHWKALTTLIIIPMAAILLGNLVSETGAAIYDHVSASGPILEILGFIVFLAAGVFMVAAAMGLIHSIHKLSSEAGAALHVWSEYKIGFRYFWPLVLLGIIRGAAMLGAFAVLVIPGIILATYTIFISFSLVIDDKRGFAAFADSFALVHGRWWKVLGRLLYLVICYMAAVLIMAGIFFIARTLFHYTAGSVADGIVSGVVMTALPLVFIPYAMTYLYKLFTALKEHRLHNDHPHTKLFKDFLIAFIVIGALLFVGAIFAGRVFGPGHGPKRLPSDTNIAAASHGAQIASQSNGNLVV
jgi:hypothetical protein